MPSAWEQFFAPVGNRDRASAEFWNPSHTIDGVPINYGGPDGYQSLPGILGQVPNRFVQYAQTYPDRWNRLWSLGSQVLSQVPNYRITNPNNTIPMFAEAFLRNGAAGLADLWSSGNQGRSPSGELQPWSLAAPVPGILNRILGLDVSNEASNRINAASGTIGGVDGLPESVRYQLAQQGRANRSVNDMILGIGDNAPQFDQQPQQGVDWNRVSQAISPFLATMQPQRSPTSWYGNTANAGGSRVPGNYGSPY